MSDQTIVHLALPKGRMQENVQTLLGDAGIRLTFDRRGYRPTLSLEGFETKLLKPQNIVEMLHVGSRDVGFAGADWVAEKEVELVELFDTGMDPVRIVGACEPSFLREGRPRPGQFLVATEYERLTRRWLEREQLEAGSFAPMGLPKYFRRRTPTASSTTR